VLLGLATLGTPAPFATLDKALAGRVVGHIFAREAWLSLALAVLLLAMERARAQRAAAAGQGSVLSTEMLLVLGTVFCTVAGYFGLQPLMAAARAGQGAFSFGQLHAISFGLFGLKIVLLLALAWRAQRPPANPAGLSRPATSS
jgi:hypothetical protein